MNRIKLKHIALGILTGYGITFILLLILALIETLTSFGESFSEAQVNAIGIFGIFIAGLWSARHITSGGWIVGGITGILFQLILRLFGTAVYHAEFLTIQILPLLLFGFAAGALGGIAGINMGYRKRRKKH